MTCVYIYNNTLYNRIRKLTLEGKEDLLHCEPSRVVSYVLCAQRTYHTEHSGTVSPSVDPYMTLQVFLPGEAFATRLAKVVALR